VTCHFIGCFFVSFAEQEFDSRLALGRTGVFSSEVERELAHDVPRGRASGAFEGRWQCPLFRALRTHLGPRLR
jgi:hypothetical protein